MSRPTESLQKAHALSAEASLLLSSPSPPLSTLETALGKYRLAADLFSSASQTMKGADEGTIKTLQMLVLQHKKLVRDLERRVGLAQRAMTGQGEGPVGQRPIGRRSATVPAPSRAVHNHESASQDGSTSPIKRPGGPTGLGLGLAAVTSPSLPPNPFTLSSTSTSTRLAPGGVYGTRGPPPFALRPTPTQPDQTQLKSSTLSPLYSSSSSSDPDPAESYITFGLNPSSSNREAKDVDPFSKFWGMLEDCLDQVSRPVVFAGAPLRPVEDMGGLAEGRAEDIGMKEKGKDKEIERTASPSDSYYMIPSDTPAQPKQPSRAGRKGTPSSSKTPEELVLENESLRLSLDALAVHSQSLEKENNALKARSLERDCVLREVAEGVRKEAEKARLDTSILLRSQVLPPKPQNRISRESGPSPLLSSGPDRPRNTSTVVQPEHIPTDKPNSDTTAEEMVRLKARVKDLEEEAKALKVDNERQKEHIQKYRDRFDKIKASARAKRGVKDGTGAGSTKLDEG